jgi:hypothetical protein
MSSIKLDPRKLLGFKIVAAGETTAVQSPKIGGKLCTTMAERDMAGTFVGTPIGGKLD